MALYSGCQYELKSQSDFGKTKQAIFVKFTDSSIRSVEEYIKGQKKFSKPPQIKFGDTKGELIFPSQHNNGQTTYSFSLSSTSDMEGPAGSFECIQSNSSNSTSLLSLGSIPYKIRINANEDVYETTRHRMTEVEDKYKNKCTREIKPNQTDIGRKLRVNTNSQLSNSLAKNPPHKHVLSMRESLMKSSQPIFHQTPSPPFVKPPQINTSSSAFNNHNNNNNNTVSNSQTTSNSAQRNSGTAQQNGRRSDVARRPLKERLIHLLALRPLKKIEIHERLSKEGFRGCDSMTNVLTQIATSKDNCFYLKNNMWNEVQEDWPYYTETEKKLLRRSKPSQNLTPPSGGSDGNSRSPISIATNSPPMIPSSTNSNNGLKKRPSSAYNGTDVLAPHKKQRIAHGNRQSSSNPGPPREIFGIEKQTQLPPHLLESPVTQEILQNTLPLNQWLAMVNKSKESANMNPRSRESSNNGSRPLMENGRQNFTNSQLTLIPPMYENENIESTNNRLEISPNCPEPVVSSPNSQTECLSEQPFDEKYSDYKKQYVTITSAEQKQAYKADFNAEYPEYKLLYPVLLNAAKKFQKLAQQLRKLDRNSHRYYEIRMQIYKEFSSLEKEGEHEKKTERFNYLHKKLNHIRDLIDEFNSKQSMIEC